MKPKADRPVAVCVALDVPEATGRELRCVARYLPSGIDLRLMQGQEFRRTELHGDADAATAKATEWKAALLERGWRDL